MLLSPDSHPQCLQIVKDGEHLLGLGSCAPASHRPTLSGLFGM